MGKATSCLEQRGQRVGCEFFVRHLRAVQQQASVVVELAALRASPSKVSESLDGLVDLFDVEIDHAHDLVLLPSLIHWFQLPTQGAQKMPPVMVTLPEIRSTWP